MSIHFNGEVSCVIPLEYHCSNCGKKVAATIPLTKSYSGSYGSLTGYQKQQQIKEAAKNEAMGRLREHIIEIYAQDPLDCKEPIIGTCAACGHKEIWQMSAKSYKSQSILGTLLGIAILIACVIIPFMLNNLSLLPVFLIGVPVLLIAYFLIAEKIKKQFPSKKVRELQAAIDNLPKENKPKYILSRTEMIKQLRN